MSVPAVMVDSTCVFRPRRVEVLLGAALAAAHRVPVACRADAAVLAALGLEPTPPEQVDAHLGERGVALLARASDTPDLPPPGAAGARLVLAVSGDETAKAVAEATKAADAEVALTVTGAAGAEMFDPAGQSLLYQLQDGVLKRRRVRASDCGLPDNDPAFLSARDAAASARALEGVAAGRGAGHNRPESAERALHHAVAMNAALILLAAGLAVSLQDGAEMAKADVAAGCMASTLSGLRGGKRV